MLGNGTGGVLGNVLAAMLVHIYNFLYKPNDITSVFTEFNDYIAKLFAKGWFNQIFSAMQIIGIGMLAASCLMALMDKVSQGDFSINVIFRHLLKYVILYMVLINITTIFNYLLDWTSASFIDINDAVTSAMTNNTAATINQTWMANGINKYVGLTAKLGMIIVLAVPYIVSVVFYIVLYFFAVSRLLEIVIRVAAAPFVVGVSFFGQGANSDIVRYTKRSLGVFFQIVVILIISVMVNFTHSALITSGSSSVQNGAMLANPASSLTLDDSYVEIGVTETKAEVKKDDDGNEEVTVAVGDTEWKAATKEDVTTQLVLAYTKDSIQKFIYYIVDPNHYFISTGLMIAALLLVFKSREISTRLFA